MSGPCQPAIEASASSRQLADVAVDAHSSLVESGEVKMTTGAMPTVTLHGAGCMAVLLPAASVATAARLFWPTANDTAVKMAEFGWAAKKNIPVSLDIEQNTVEYSAGGTAAYVRGWVNRIRSLGYVPYVYANPDTVNYLAGEDIPFMAQLGGYNFLVGFGLVVISLLMTMKWR